jgi:SAM-dependent methyltransferase
MFNSLLREVVTRLNYSHARRIVADIEYSKLYGVENSLAVYSLHYLLSNFTFETVLDLGFGRGIHSHILSRSGKTVTSIDTGDSIYTLIPTLDSPDIKFIYGNYLDYEPRDLFDCIWVSHVLEHQRDVGTFVDKIFADLKVDGILALTIPPFEKTIASGHINNFHIGNVFYHLVLCGFDCTDARLLTYGYNQTIFLAKKPIRGKLQLSFDSGDLALLKPYFPPFLRQLWIDDNSLHVCGVKHSFNL